jgi:hypothetical protein
MQTPEEILTKIRSIQEMERGTLCRMRDTAVGPLYNHQTWEKGRNVVRYVPRDQVAGLKKAIAGYRRFIRLTQAYADLVIKETRKKHKPRPSRRRN